MPTKQAIPPLSRRNCRMGSSDRSWEPQPEAWPTNPDHPATGSPELAQSPQELQEESRKIRRLQMVVNMVMQVIIQDSNLTVEEASEMVADTRRAALAPIEIGR